jgi:hypothetical protein
MLCTAGFLSKVLLLSFSVIAAPPSAGYRTQHLLLPWKTGIKQNQVKLRLFYESYAVMDLRSITHVIIFEEGPTHTNICITKGKIELIRSQDPDLVRKTGQILAKR